MSMSIVRVDLSVFKLRSNNMQSHPTAHRLEFFLYFLNTFDFLNHCTFFILLLLIIIIMSKTTQKLLKHSSPLKKVVTLFALCYVLKTESEKRERTTK